ncbi:Stringent starvation protein A [hydrothermal vent metagenome]|uniref:Stringent starvation protein A n=1 Tax=hydrothermal vent metagenome TaxID=652676 RepID=A0A3B1A5D1_9ZZZZ
MAQVANKRLAMMLFSSDSNLYCHMVRIVLAEKGISYDSTFVDLDNTPENLQELNPYNEVPTLVDRELALYDQRVIVEYLDERFPHPPLMPVDPVSRSRIRLLLQRIERDWMSLSNKINSGEDVENARKALQDSLVGASPIFEQKPFFMSDEYTLIDCALAALLWRLPSYGITLPAQAKALINYADSLFEREAFKESLTETEKELRV